MNVKFLVKLCKEKAFVKNPTRRTLVLVHLPPLGDNAILDNARVGDQCVDTPCGHHSHRVAVMNSAGSVFHRFLARGNRDGQHKGQYIIKVSQDGMRMILVYLPLGEPTLVERKSDVDAERILGDEVLGLLPRPQCADVDQ